MGEVGDEFVEVDVYLECEGLYVGGFEFGVEGEVDVEVVVGFVVLDVIEVIVVFGLLGGDDDEWGFVVGGELVGGFVVGVVDFFVVDEIEGEFV